MSQMSFSNFPSFLRSIPLSLKMPDADVFRLISMSFPEMNITPVHFDALVMLAVCSVALLGFAFVGCLLFLNAIDSANEVKGLTNIGQTAYADHPLVKLTVDTLVQRNIPFGYIRKEKELVHFYELKNIELDGSVLYCSYKGKLTPVSLVLANEKNLRRPRWLNHVYVGVPFNTEIRHMLLKDFITVKYDLVFT